MGSFLHEEQVKNLEKNVPAAAAVLFSAVQRAIL